MVLVPCYLRIETSPSDRLLITFLEYLLGFGQQQQSTGFGANTNTGGGIFGSGGTSIIYYLRLIIVIKSLWVAQTQEVLAFLRGLNQ